MYSKIEKYTIKMGKNHTNDAKSRAYFSPLKEYNWQKCLTSRLLAIHYTLLPIFLNIFINAYSPPPLVRACVHVYPKASKSHSREETRDFRGSLKAPTNAVLRL